MMDDNKMYMNLPIYINGLSVRIGAEKLVVVNEMMFNIAPYTLIDKIIVRRNFPEKEYYTLELANDYGYCLVLNYPTHINEYEHLVQFASKIAAAVETHRRKTDTSFEVVFREIDKMLH